MALSSSAPKKQHSHVAAAAAPPAPRLDASAAEFRRRLAPPAAYAIGLTYPAPSFLGSRSRLDGGARFICGASPGPAFANVNVNGTRRRRRQATATRTHTSDPEGVEASGGAGAEGTRLRLLTSGGEALERMEALMAGARRSVELRTFIWRADPAGLRLARAALAAAAAAAASSSARTPPPSSAPSTASPPPPCPAALAEAAALRAALLAHPNVACHAGPARDHTKASPGPRSRPAGKALGHGRDAAGRPWRDYALELAGPAAVARLRGGWRATPGSRRGGARWSSSELWIEMAYLGFNAVTEAVAAACRERGVRVRLLLPARANVQHATNLAVARWLAREAAPGPGSIEVRLHPHMLHSKAALVDGARALVGSCNWNATSLGVFGELSAWCSEPALAAALRAEMHARWREARPRHPAPPPSL
eukprot:tig00001368_g8401.t1